MHNIEYYLIIIGGVVFFILLGIAMLHTNDFKEKCYASGGNHVESIDMRLMCWNKETAQRIFPD